ncbi:allantoinase AllB [Brevibacterium luteolum]|uniref:allantoinase AllB n=1 Tax=Brevibacterium luteolum TaxID=199591 RepID=UPI003B676539
MPAETIYDTVIKAQRAVIGAEQIERAVSIGINGGRIAAIEPLSTALRGKRQYELDSRNVLLPGGVDCHVHVNEPGRTHWEGFRTATRAAIAGGITTIVDMPLNSIPPTVNTSALKLKRDTARNKIWCDVGFWGGLIPGNTAELEPLHRAGVVGFKCFMSDSGVPEFPPVSRQQMSQAMVELARLDATLIVHAESSAHFLPDAEQNSSFEKFLATRPEQSEAEAVRTAIGLAEKTKCRLHFVHISTAAAVGLIRAAKARRVRVSAETCPHYLFFDAALVPDGATEFKCCPPIRDSQNRDFLWEALRDGTLDFIVSDHSPSPADLKLVDEGDFTAAWGGIASLQVSLSAVWTEAQKRGFGLHDLVRWQSFRPAQFVGLPQKGNIEVGNDADLIEFDPSTSWTVVAPDLHHRHPITPYDTFELRGLTRQTWLRGSPVQPDSKPHGSLLERSTNV